MRIPIILLSFKQLSIFGVHIGHDYKNVFFLSSWIFYAWHKNIFIINLYKTFLHFRYSLLIFTRYASNHRPIWYVCIRSPFSALVSRYAYTVGELFSTYWWINGSVTNFFRVLGWSQLVARIMILNKYDLRFKDKKRMARFFGLINHRKRLPGAGFAPTILTNLGAVEEFLAGRIPCVGIVDSNAPSSNLMIPVPGNDDSGVCINFYCYILSKSILAGKINYVFLWKWQIRKYRKEKKKVVIKYRNLSHFIYLYSNFYKYSNKNSFSEVFNIIFKDEKVINISKEKAINIWLNNTNLISGYSNYSGKLFTLLGERTGLTDLEDFQMDFV